MNWGQKCNAVETERIKCSCCTVVGSANWKLLIQINHNLFDQGVLEIHQSTAELHHHISVALQGVSNEAQDFVFF